jgi:hypothetical protein|tara:strand:- start:623 stop:1144 length:522 start_codon:yes stop_codon:yes gene_type:complete
MSIELEPELDAPIPGMSLTHELGARPWQTPPEMATVEDAIDFYIPRIGNPKTINQVLGLLESGTPLTNIAETMTLVGTMEGKHTVDVAVLMNPIIVEYLKGIGDITQTPYRLQRDDMDMEANPILAEKALQELNNENKVTEEQQTEIADLSKDILKEEKKGLMSRPVNEEEEI